MLLETDKTDGEKKEGLETASLFLLTPPLGGFFLGPIRFAQLLSRTVCPPPQDPDTPDHINVARDETLLQRHPPLK